jgi:glutathione synthase/RimK-type ligase-like ATP-grasp enzyme
MIVLFGSITDETLAAVVVALADRGADLLLIDPRDEPANTGLAFEPATDRLTGWLRCGERSIELTAVRSVYVRDTGPIRERRSLERHVALCGLLDSWPTLVVNRPSATASGSSKPYQAQVISSCGLAAPRTLITTNPADARAFYDACDGRVIFKSASHLRSIVQRLETADLDRLDQLHACPTQFQEYVAGIDVRVHIVGERIFATEIDTTATDYRYAGRVGAEMRMRDTRLPDEIATACQRLAVTLQLALTGIDLRRTPDGRWYCFEANPSPVFTYYERYTGQPLTDAVCELLHNAGDRPMPALQAGSPGS